jgi:hypothetical protein
MNKDYALKLRSFADKLASDAFKDESQIKHEMESLGLVYCTDEIERLNRVLLALHPLCEEITLNEKPKQELNH